jgi:hypothetical protein
MKRRYNAEVKYIVLDKIRGKKDKWNTWDG